MAGPYGLERPFLPFERAWDKFRRSSDCIGLINSLKIGVVDEELLMKVMYSSGFSDAAECFVRDKDADKL